MVSGAEAALAALAVMPTRPALKSADAEVSAASFLRTRFIAVPSIRVFGVNCS
jgi:hypothetical protein